MGLRPVKKIKDEITKPIYQIAIVAIAALTVAIIAIFIAIGSK